MTRIFHRLFLWKWMPCQAVTSVFCLLFRPKTVHWSTKNAYTSEITFLALHPWSGVPCTLSYTLNTIYPISASSERVQKNKFELWKIVQFTSIIENYGNFNSLKIRCKLKQFIGWYYKNWSQFSFFFLINRENSEWLF